MTTSEQRLVSIICCTEGRREFMPWLAHIYGALRTPLGWCKELVVVDSTPDASTEDVIRGLVDPLELIYQHYDRPRSPVACKRNLGMDIANGDVLGWLDDDDGKAPGWLVWALEHLGDHDMLKVKTLVEFVNILMTPPRAKWMATIWYSAGLYTVDAARAVKFDERRAVGEDVHWHGRMMARVPGPQTTFVKQEGIGLALTHKKNVANTGKHQIKYYHEVKNPGMWSPDEWQATVVEMQKLRSRIDEH